MKQFVAFILATLCFPFVTSLLTQVDMYSATTTSPDKVVRIGLIYLCFIALSFSAKRFGAVNLTKIIVPISIILIILISHQLLPYSLTSFYFNANKEVLRVGGILFFLVTTVVLSRNHGVDWRLFVKITTILGVVAGIGSIYFSLHAQVSSWRQVAGYTRAGDGVMDANSLAAYLNMVSFIAASGYFIVKRKAEKLFFIASILIIQLGRIVTFSTGSYLSLGISLIFLLFLSKRLLNVSPRTTKIVIVSLIVSATILLAFTEIGKVALSRLLMEDEGTRRSSVYSRKEQYVWFFNYFLTHPIIWFFGGGNSLMASITPNGLEIHSSPLRALGGTGIVGFWAYFYYIFKVFKGLYLKAHNRKNKETQIIAIFVLSSFVGWLIQSCTIPADTSILHYYFLTVSFVLFFSKENGLHVKRESSMPRMDLINSVNRLTI